MKLILHHLLKDIRAQRWLLLLWAFVLLARIILNALIFQPDYALAKFVEAIWASPFLMFINAVAWTILLARLIQSEPVTGSTSFWLTRPIPLRVYVFSKLVFILVLIVLPSFLPSLFYMFQFQSSTEMLKENLEVLSFVQIVGGICVIWLATYTPSILHFVGIFCVGMLGIVLVVALTTTVAPIPPNQPGDVGDCMIILIPGLLASLIVQYAMRRTRVGVVLGIMSLAIACAAQALWPRVTGWPRFTGPLPSRADVPKKTVPIEFSPDWQKGLSWEGHEPFRKATAYLTPVAIDPDLQPVVKDIISTFQVPGEKPVGLTDESMFSILTRPEKLLQEKFPNYSITSDNHNWDIQPPLALFDTDPVFKKKLDGKTGILILKIRGQMRSLVEKVEIPLNQPHFIARIPGGFIRVRPFDPNGNTTLVVWEIESEPDPFEVPQSFIYVLVDPQDRTGKALNEGGWGGPMDTYSFTSHIASFHLIDSETHLSLKGDEPLDRMILEIYELKPSATFESTLTAPNFTMNPK